MLDISGNISPSLTLFPLGLHSSITSPVSTHRLTSKKSKIYKPTKPNSKKPTPKLAFAWNLYTS